MERKMLIWHFVATRAKSATLLFSKSSISSKIATESNFVEVLDWSQAITDAVGLSVHSVHNFLLLRTLVQLLYTASGIGHFGLAQCCIQQVGLAIF
jgi:hypothetical protein